MSKKNEISDLTDQFRLEIKNGELPYGIMLPPEKELAIKFNVSRPTISKVYDTLQSEGLIKKKAGSGTCVVFSKNNKHYTLGLLLPGAGESEIFGVINDQFMELSKQKDFTFLWDGTVTNNADMRQSIIMKICQSYIEKKVDGIFFSPLERTHNAHIVNESICKILDSEKIPLILIDRDIYPFPNRSKHDIVGIDNFHAGYVMTNCLVKNGCESIHFFCRKDSANSVGIRLAGCRSACSNAGIVFNDSNIFCGEPSDCDLVRKISVIPGKTGILCANDTTAAVLMSSLNKLGIKVSSDVLMAGINDMKYSKHLQVQLTSYRQPLLEIASISIEMMLRRLSNPNKPVCTVNVTGKIIERDSSKFI